MKIIAIPSPNFEDRQDEISLVIIHAMATKDLEASFTYLIDSVPPKPLSSHYIIDRDGTVYALVSEDKTAYHAGKSDWNGYCKRTGRTGLNHTSIGIELQGEWDKTLSEKYFGHFTEEQMNACIELCQRIQKRYNLSADDFIGHSDCAPDRKNDPGEHFDWKRLRLALSNKNSSTLDKD